MKQTIITSIAAMFLGGILVYLLLQPASTVAPNQVNVNSSSISLESEQNKEMIRQAEMKRQVELVRKQERFNNTWRKYITVEKEGGSQGGFAGGFSDVTVRVKNDSDYMIDETYVIVKIYRGLLHDKLCHTEIVSVYNIPSNSEKSIKYSYDNCGQELFLEAGGIVCKELNILHNVSRLEIDF